MPSKAASLVAQAKEWATRYGPYANGEEGAVLTVPLRLRVAWDNNDSDAYADLFTENGSELIGDDQLTSREEIRSYMAKAFAGVYKGTRYTEHPVEIRLLSDDAALAITEGGILQNGETEVALERSVRATWIVVKQNGEWKLFSHQTSPIKG
jgi:uncharacterized protein (TIGR02246 family)